MSGAGPALPRIAAVLGGVIALAGLVWLAATRMPPSAVPAARPGPAASAAPGARAPLASRRPLPADPSDAVLLVVGPTLQPIPHATAQTVERSCPTLQPETEAEWHADAAGELRIPAAAAQDAAARERAFAVYAPEHAPALVADLRAGATTRVVLQPGHAVRLRAIDALDRPVAGIRVALVGSALTQREGRALAPATVLVRTAAAAKPIVTGVTDAAGEAVLRGVPSGPYQVRADTTGTPYLLDAEVRRQVVQVPSAPVWFRLIEPVAFAIKPKDDEIRLFRYVEHDQRRWISGSNTYAEQLRGKELELAARHPEHAVAVRLPRPEGLDDASATVAIASLEHGWHVLQTRFVPLSRLAPEELPAPDWPPVPWGSVQVELRDANDRLLPAEHALGLLVTEPVPSPFQLHLGEGGRLRVPPGTYALHGSPFFPQAWIAPQSARIRSGEDVTLRVRLPFPVVMREVVPELPSGDRIESCGFSIQLDLGGWPEAGEHQRFSAYVTQRGDLGVDEPLRLWIPERGHAILRLYAHGLQARTRIDYGNGPTGRFVWRIGEQ